MAENETNGTDLLAALSKQLESQQATIEKLNQQMLDQIALTESNNQTNQVNLNSVSVEASSIAWAHLLRIRLQTDIFAVYCFY